MKTIKKLINRTNFSTASVDEIKYLSNKISKLQPNQIKELVNCIFDKNNSDFTNCKMLERRAYENNSEYNLTILFENEKLTPYLDDVILDI